MEVSEYLVGSPAFKAGGTGDPRTAGSIPVHLRQSSPEAKIGEGATFRRKAKSGRFGALDSRCGRPEAETVRPSKLGSNYLSLRLQGVLTGLLVLLVLFVSGSVGAQAVLLSSMPADGESVLNIDEVVFEFNTLLRIDDAEISVLRRDGTEFPYETLTVVENEVSATYVGQIPSGNYEVSYAVEGADGARNVGSIRVSVDSPEQALSGGLLAIIGIAVAMSIYLAVVLRNDKRRRPSI